MDAAYAAALDAATSATQQQQQQQQQALEPSHLLLRQPIHFLKIDVEGFELQALESAAGLFEQGLIEHAVLEFGPPNRWDGSVADSANLTQTQKRAQTTAHAKQLLHRATSAWNMDIYLLPAIGWERTIKWMIAKGISFNPAAATDDDHKIVHRLRAWDFDHQPLDNDEFERELIGKNQLVTELIPLREDLIDEYMDILESIGEMYLWFAKRDGNPAVLANVEV
ncbi:hypothetical protein BX666DRAFT_1867254 [Dichotomocladium elegans]|nr:hypothetical protein BX666DRAFT_1867254 [Dichotomocladium elegans]